MIRSRIWRYGAGKQGTSDLNNKSEAAANFQTESGRQHGSTSDVRFGEDVRNVLHTKWQTARLHCHFHWCQQITLKNGFSCRYGKATEPVMLTLVPAASWQLHPPHPAKLKKVQFSLNIVCLSGPARSVWFAKKMSPNWLGSTCTSVP